MIDLEEARELAREWIAAWNSHDLERILSHYTDDFEMSSPYIVEVMGEASGRLKGKDRVGAYWRRALDRQPQLKFELIDVFAGAGSIAVHYRSVGRKMSCEVLIFNEARKVVRGIAHYAGPAA